MFYWRRIMRSRSLMQFASSKAKEFSQHFDKKASWIAAAPGRVNLIGEHVDYNDGIVLPFAIDRYTVVAGAANQTNSIVIHSQSQDGTLEIDLKNELVPVGLQNGYWGNYVSGVLAGFRERGYSLSGFDALIGSSIPSGGGLSSSAALEVAFATFLEAMLNVELTKSEKALLCQQAEHRFAGVPCGIMDQYASVFGAEGNLVKLDCRSLEIELIPWQSEDVGFLIINSNVRHELSGGEYSNRREQCRQVLAKLQIDSFRDLDLATLCSYRNKLDDVDLKRAKHVVSEIQRSLETVDAIKARNWVLVGQKLIESHSSLRDDFEVSCPELDFLVEAGVRLGRDNGVYGIRMTGGGFGGCAVALVDKKRSSFVAKSICENYQSQFEIAPSSFATLPSCGAAAIDFID